MRSCFCRTSNPCEVCNGCQSCSCTCRIHLRPAAETLPHPKRRRGANPLPGPPFLVPTAPSPPFTSPALTPGIRPASVHDATAPTLLPPPHVPAPPSAAPSPQPLRPTVSPPAAPRPSPPPLRPVTVAMPTLTHPPFAQSSDRGANCFVSTNRPDAPGLFEAQRSTLSNALTVLGADNAAVAHLQYSPSIASFDPSKNRTAVRLMNTVIQGAAKLICPTDPSGLAERFTMRDSPGAQSAIHERLVNSVIAAMKATRRGTVARRYVRSVLCGSMSRSEVNQLLGYPPGGPDEDVAVNMCGPNRPVTIQGDEQDDDDDDCESQLADGDRLPRMSSKTFSRSRRDWDMLMDRGELQAAKFGRSRVQDEALRNLLEFLFSSGNISLTSWTRRKLVVNGQKLELPAVVVSKKSSLMHESYCKLVQSMGLKPLSRGSFYAVTKTLTRREVKRVMPVDNMTQSLVRDPLTLLRDLIMRVTPYQYRAKFLKQVDNVEWFMVHSYSANHIGKDSSATHDLSFALQSDALQSAPRAMFDRPVECPGFSCPFALLDDLYNCGRLDDRSADVPTLANCRDRFLCYLALLCCKSAQDRAIERALAEIVSNRLSNRVVIFMNHLRSSEAARTSKSHLIQSIDGVSMHGSVVFFIGNEDASESGSGDLDSLFYNHVVCNDSEDDVAVIALVVEALLARIRQDLTRAKEVIFVTDNSPRYKNDILPSLLPHLAKVSGFSASRYIYTCSQLCEFLIDAHFEVVMKFIQERLRQGETVSPDMVVDAINHQQQFPNIAGELLLLDAEHRKFSSRLQSERFSFPSIGDRNTIEYKEWIEGDYETQLEQCASIVRARVYDYCGIGRGQPFEIKNSWMTALHNDRKEDDLRRSVEVSKEEKWFGPVTGVKVVKSARKLQPLRVATTNTEDATSEGVVVDAIALLQSFAREDTSKTKRGATDSEGISHDDGVATGPVCTACKRVFKSRFFLKAHICKGTPLEKDVSARAVVVASDLFREGKLPFFRDEAGHLSFSMHDPQAKPKYAIPKLWYGWARQPFGFRRSTIADELLETCVTLTYRQEVFEILKNEPDAEKMTPADIHGTLRLKHEGTDDLPSEKRVRYWHQLHEASQRIQPYYVIGPDGVPMMSYKEPAQSPAGGKSRMSPLYISKITEMHNRYFSLPEFGRPKPRVMYREFVKFFEDEQGRLPPDFPEQKQVMNKINALRTKSRAERHQQ